MLFGTAAALANGAALPMFAIVIGNVLNTIGGAAGSASLVSNLQGVILDFVYLAIVSLVAGFMQMAFWMLTGARQSARIRARYLAAVLQQEVSFFDTEATTGKIMNELNEDCSAVANFLQQSATFVAGMIVAFTKSWSLTLVLLALAPVIGTAGYLVSMLSAKLSTRAADAYAEAAVVVAEALANIRTVLALCGAPVVVQTYTASLAEPTRTGKLQGAMHGITLGLANGAFLCAYALALWFGSTRVQAGSLTGGEVMTVLMSAIIAMMSLGRALPETVYFQRGCVAMARLLAVIRRRPRMAATDGGETPANGAVLLDGRDLRSLSLPWFRARVGLVSQEPTLFATTIARNIAALTDVSQSAIEDAARAANAHDFIMGLPRKYETLVGEKGIHMSGGQKQRIAIARAILKNPDMLLLDEATSALDNTSERIVQQALDRLAKNRTTIIVAHRLSTIVNADTVAVVGQGRIVEIGGYAELAAPGGAFASLMKIQMMGAEAGAVAEATADAPPGSPKGKLAAVEELSTQGASKAADSAAVAKVKGPGFWRLLSYNRPEWHWICLGLVGSAIVGLIMPTFALSLSNVIAILFVPDYSYMNQEVKRWGAVFGIAAAIAVGGSVLQQMGFAAAGLELTRRLRVLLLSAILRQEVAFFDLPENASGAQSSRLAVDTAAIRGAVGDQVGALVQSLVTFIAGYAIAFTYNWKLTLVVSASVPCIALAGLMQGKVMFGLNYQVSKAADVANQIAAEAVAAIRTVAAFGMEAALTQQFRLELRKPWAKFKQSALVTGLAFGSSFAAIFLVYALAFYYGGQLVAWHEATFGDVLKVFFAIVLAAFGLLQAQLAFPDLTKAQSAVQRVFGVLDRHSKIDPSAEGRTLATVKGHLALEEVGFAYPARAEAPVFSRFSLQVPPGTSLALVGASGSGKSSVISLIMRFYDVTSGAVRLDGVDIRELSLMWYRGQLALVSQEPVLFSGTIRDNIAGWRDVTDEEVQTAAVAANAAGFISRAPDGYATKLGNGGGVQLSGGEKARIAIARAVIRQPRILLLDEATSALDAESEATVQAALVPLMAGRTTVVVAHRLSTVRHCDTIAVLEAGRILESGPHAALMANPGGPYAQLVRHTQR
ncbi:hypothetical protein WJX81_005240 [Elliptochloris bilobata]|uniref:ATP-binding cassette transporter n=1 Tax=Elliptochloris bilobata TaxID=381761 RepID=A0AAW1SLV7_9CHLO